MLRPYQTDAVLKVREHYINGHKKVLLHLSTGGGKTVIFSEIIKRTVKSGNYVVMVVRGRHLVNQASDRLLRENVAHGVLMSGHKNYKPDELVQICSIDTLISRELTPKADLIVIDEAHMAISKGYKDWISKYSDAFILSVTATPFVTKSLKHIADVIVKPITFDELVSQKFLVPAIYYSPTIPDLSSVQVSRTTGDYKNEELDTLINTSCNIGDIVAHWKKHSNNAATICFAANIKHSLNIVNQFNSMGIKAEHCEAETKDAERVEILSRLKTGETKVVSNVGILCTGVDIPYVRTIIMARPTKSYNLYIQQAGRGTRPFEGKENFLILDHSGNVLRHGFINEERECDLEGTEIKESIGIRTCATCAAVYRGNSCPYGCKLTEKEIYEIKCKIDAELSELKELPFEAQVRREILRLKEVQKKRGYKRGWVFHQLVNKYGEQVANRFMPKRVVPEWIRMKNTRR